MRAAADSTPNNIAGAVVGEGLRMVSPGRVGPRNATCSRFADGVSGLVAALDELA
jgi:hypothetical protein